MVALNDEIVTVSWSSRQMAPGRVDAGFGTSDT
jgi:hypothetical protein